MLGWFKKHRPAPSVEPKVSDDPPGEAEKLAKIKHICWMAKMSAESIAGLPEEALKEEFNAYELERYQRFLLQATNLAREITDSFYRDAALHFLIDLLMVAGDEAQAKKLYVILEIDMIQEKVREAYPRLAAKF